LADDVVPLAEECVDLLSVHRKPFAFQQTIVAARSRHAR
jgi:hypothetical protein